MKIRESIANFLLRGSYNELRESARADEMTASHFKERYHELQAHLRMQQGGWQVLGDAGNKDIDNKSLSIIRRTASVLYLTNPLINRGVNVQVDYVFGQGVTVRCDDDAANKVLQEFWDDVKNKAELTDNEALQDKEREQQLNGEHFFVFFTDRLSGRTRVRTYDPDEIEDIITNPEDAKDPWFYKRTWTAQRLDFATGKVTSEARTSYYPDWNYNPARKPKTIAGDPIEWDRPIYHVKTGALRRMKRGVSEVYCQIDWVRAYTQFLENRASVASALSRITTKVKEVTRKGVEAVTKRLGSGISRPGTGALGTDINTAPVAGSTAVLGPGRELEAVSVKGATIHPDEGRAFKLMVACGKGLPETFYGDVSVGTLATAESLDRPTELMMQKRRDFWATVLTNIALYVLKRSIQAPGSPLKGKVTYRDNTPTVLLADGKAAEIHVDFPDLLEHDADKQIGAIDKAAKHIPDLELIATLVLKALKVDKIDERLKKMDFNKLQAERDAARQAKSQPKTKPSPQPATS